MEIMVVQIAADGVEIAPYQKQGKGFTQLSKMFWTTLQSWREPNFQKEGVGVRAAMNPQSKVWGTEDKRIIASWTMTIFCHRELSLSISVSRAIYVHCWKPSQLGVKANPLRRTVWVTQRQGLHLLPAGGTQSKGLGLSLVTLLVTPVHTVLYKGVSQVAQILLNGAQDCLYRWPRSTSCCVNNCLGWR